VGDCRANRIDTKPRKKRHNGIARYRRLPNADRMRLIFKKGRYSMKTLSALVALVLLSAIAGQVEAQPAGQPGYAPAGALNCTMSSSVGVIIAGSQDLRCVFTPTVGIPENYVGRITTVGIDIGVTTGGVLGWAVLMAGSTPYPPAALGGNYVGASADVSVGIGGGANILIGGNNRAFALQPLSTQAQTGLNLAAGLTGLELRFVP
jgi:Protein of unknown function (DUF992)